jgi:NAD(P)-dependent dehydrogenase (short-subunit alcohol dehydrogenase family)
MENKLVLITGAAKRIGKVIALSLAEAGWSVVVHYNTSKNEAEDVVNQIKNLGRKACAVQADLTNEAQARKVFSEVNEQIGAVTCLINNASILKNDTINNVTNSSWNENINTNLYAPVILIQEFIKQLPEGQAGNIINMLDYAVLRYPEKFMSYMASKAALWALTQQLALALAPQKIRVNGIGPGKILQNIYENPDNFAKGRKSAPLGADSTPEEIAHAVKFILSAPSLTGQLIALDGGKHLIGPEVY